MCYMCSRWASRSVMVICWVFSCTFMKLHMAFQQFLLGCIFIFFDRFWAIFDPIGGHVGPVLGYLGTKMGSFWGHLRIILASVWGHFGCFGVVLTPFWGLFWALFGPSLGHFGPFLRHFYDHFSGFWWCFGKLTEKNKQNGARGSGLRIQQECVISRGILLRLPWNLTGMLIREPSQWSLFGSRCSAYSRMYTTHGGDPSQQKC